MNKFLIPAVTLLTLIVLWFAPGTIARVQRAEGPKERQVDYARGTPIMGQLHDSDDVLVIRSGSLSPGLELAPPAGMTLAEWKARSADCVAVVQVSKRAPDLTPAGDWIRTTVTAVVYEVIKNCDSTLFAQGTPITFLEDGGEITRGKQRIVARIPWAEPLKEGANYLMFADVSADRRIVPAAYDLYEINGAAFRSRRLPAMNDHISMLQPSVVLHEIRQKAHLGRPQR